MEGEGNERGGGEHESVVTIENENVLPKGDEVDEPEKEREWNEDISERTQRRWERLCKVEVDKGREKEREMKEKKRERAKEGGKIDKRTKKWRTRKREEKEERRKKEREGEREGEVEGKREREGEGKREREGEGKEEEEKIWDEIESEPVIFMNMIEAMGVKGVAVKEIYDIDEVVELGTHGHVYGIIMLFRWSNKEQMVRETEFEVDAPVYFALQRVDNACATQALVCVLLNGLDKGEGGERNVMVGPQLEAFHKRTASLTWRGCGEALANSTFLHAIHSKFSLGPRESCTQSQLSKRRRKLNNKEEGDLEMPFHYVAIIPKGGVVYELDGLKEAPRRIGSVKRQKGEGWLSVAANV
eukprot:Ihof_evm1s615 gene=Ihof_evmTU1s615